MNTDKAEKYLLDQLKDFDQSKYPKKEINAMAQFMESYHQSELKNNVDLVHVSESDFQEMFECLRDLMDLQNGCPLPTYKEAYEETVDRCEKILSKYED